MNVRYRILSTCAGLGYGFPQKSFNCAMQYKLDLIAADAGSIDPGPYYLGAGESYMKRGNLARDFSVMLRGALEQNCPLIVGSCGLAGDDPNLDFMVSVTKQVFEEVGVSGLKVAVISGHVDNDLLYGRAGDLKALGHMPALTDDIIKNCSVVGQMGIAPFIEALNQGAQIILAGRSCDVAIFAADPVRRGISPGLAFHAAHILECGAIACDPGSGSDCLIAEFMEDDSVVFTPPNPERRATSWSIAAHSLYEEDHPILQFYPEGVLSLEKTQYFSAGDRSAGIRSSSFLSFPASIKLEGSYRVGERVVSILKCRDVRDLPQEYILYGRNGVNPVPVASSESEVGLCIKVRSANEDAAKAQLTLIKGLWMHFGYYGRRSTAGNLAFPMSPSEISYRDHSGYFVSAIIAGSRDPFFRHAMPQIDIEVSEILHRDYTDLQTQCVSEIHVASIENPYLFLDTYGTSLEEAEAAHEKSMKDVARFLDVEASPVVRVHPGGFYAWGIYHRLSDLELVNQHMFPISLYRVDRGNWRFLGMFRSTLQGLGDVSYGESMDYSIVSEVEAVTATESPIGKKALVDMAHVVRSKNAGINKISYDIFFNTDQDYREAMRSGCFTPESVAETLGISRERVIGCYRCDACMALKISTHREILSGSFGDRDLFGAQQHTSLLAMQIPLHAPGDPIKGKS